MLAYTFVLCIYSNLRFYLAGGRGRFPNEKQNIQHDSSKSRREDTRTERPTKSSFSKNFIHTGHIDATKRVHSQILISVFFLKKEKLHNEFSGMRYKKNGEAWPHGKEN